jgi:hypothetical protein
LGGEAGRCGVPRPIHHNLTKLRRGVKGNGQVLESAGAVGT